MKNQIGRTITGMLILIATLFVTVACTSGVSTESSPSQSPFGLEGDYFRGHIVLDETSQMTFVLEEKESDFEVYCFFYGQDTDLEYDRVIAAVMLLKSMGETDFTLILGNEDYIGSMFYQAGEMSFTDIDAHRYANAAFSPERSVAAQTEMLDLLNALWPEKFPVS